MPPFFWRPEQPPGPQGGEFRPPVFSTSEFEVQAVEILCCVCGKTSDGEIHSRCRLIAQNRCRARTLRENVANRRARVLLMENLSTMQLAEWVAKQWFTVKTHKGRVFKIHQLDVYNVSFEAGEPFYAKYGGAWGSPVHPGKGAYGRPARLCVHLTNGEPIWDTLLAQKLMLECMETEQAFLEMANVG